MNVACTKEINTQNKDLPPLSHCIQCNSIRKSKDMELTQCLLIDEWTKKMLYEYIINSV